MDTSYLLNASRQCSLCTHRTAFTAKCKAFPDGIPSEILTGRADHRKPVKGDHGIQFAPRDDETSNGKASTHDALPDDLPDFDKWEADAQKVIEGAFAAEAKRVLQAFNEGGQGAVDQTLADGAAGWQSVLENLYTRIITENGQKAAQWFTEHFGPKHAQPQFSTLRPRVTEWLQQNAAARVKDIQATTETAMREVIQKGYAAGQKPSVIAKDIRATYNLWQDGSDPMTMSRAKTIARTETQMGVGFGRQEGVKQEAEAFQLTVMKTWRSFQDTRVRPDHRKMNGETVPMDQPYSNGMMHPGDPKGGPENVVNCRCWETYKAV
jgi:uncharacterized protein with gpF-like domain